MRSASFFLVVIQHNYYYVELNLEVFSLFFNYCLNDLALSELVFSCFEILDTSTYSFLPPLFITY